MNVKPFRLRRPAVEGDSDTRKLALDLMQKALALLDKDPSISPMIGAQLQLAIDRLISSRNAGSTFIR